LAALLGWAQGGVDHGSAMEVLRNFLLRAEAGRLSVYATTLTTHLTGEIPAEVSVSGAILVPARKLAELAKEAAGERVTLELDGVQLRMTLTHGTYKLATRPAEDFPAEPPLANPVRLRWDGEDLDYALETVGITTSTNDTRFNLSAALLEPRQGEAGTMRLVSTDGHRMTILDRSPVGASGLPPGPQLLIPREGLTVLRSLLKKAGEVTLEVAKDIVAVSHEGRRVAVRLLAEERFPDYSVVIPAHTPIKATIPREALRAALRRALILTDQKFKAVDLAFTADKLHVRGVAAELGEADEALEVDCNSEVNSRLNARYLLDACECMRSEQIILGMVDARHPVVITGDGDPGFKVVVMPMQ
jgi:DNA polymerase-3 subunit beta